jgi:pyroglutamyl-peptidase
VRILLTAFEPFDETGLNASLEGCRAFLERWGNRFQLQFGILPVQYGPDVEAVDRLLHNAPADVVLHTGQAGGAATVRVERVAVNQRYPNCPKDGRQAAIPITAEGPPTLVSTLPVEAVSASITQAGVAAVVSEDAGIYLCNHALYHSLRRAEWEGHETRVGFLHVPSLHQQAAGGRPSMSAEEIAVAIRATLECLETGDWPR